MAMAYQRFHGMQVRIVRIFNTYGERMRLNDGRAVPNFITQALKGRPITVYGDGSQTRSLCYISDLVEGICRLLKSRANSPVNLGNPHEITVKELAQTVRELSKSKSKIVLRPLPVDDPRQRRPDITLARKLLKWKPKVALEEGLRRTLRYYRSVR
jgi:dTDP-glucose 4,6-dehydratase